MNVRNIALTGIPRSGTTLCCNLIGQAPDTVALFEPMPVHLLPQAPEAAVQEIGRFFDASRASLLERGVASSHQIGGKVPDNPFGERRDVAGQRLREAELGQINIGKPLSPGFTLVVKHNAAFTALLEHLRSAFECYAVIRNPLAVLASWNSVDLPVANGRLPAGERLDPLLKQRLDAQPDRLERQLLLLEWLFSRFRAALPITRIVRYEQVVSTQGQALAERVNLPVPALPLRNRNSNTLYDATASAEYAMRLLSADGAWRHFYSEADVVVAQQQLMGKA